MNIKQLLYGLTPPLCLELYRLLRTKPTWQGIFSAFEEVQSEGEGLNSELWGDIVERETLAFAAQLDRQRELPPVTGDDSLLPLLVSVLAATQDHVRILDFGGGAGIDYLCIQKAVKAAATLEFQVVESERVCQRGRKIHGPNGKITFNDTLPDANRGFDIVHLDSVLQYIEDYQSLLKALCAYRPAFMLFVRLSAGEIPTYVTRQVNVPGAACPYQFLNLGDLVQTMDRLGYYAAFKGVGETECEQNNFPVQYRLKRTCNLLFARKRD